MIFVVASFCNFLGPLILGIVLDSYGPRVCSVVSILLITVGSAMFALSDTDSLPLFVPGMCLIAFGGPGTQNAIIHLSNLFPEWKATATSFIVGSFQLSFVVFLVFDQLWAHLQYSYTTLFMGYCVLCVANIAVSLFMWPDEPYNLEDSMAEQEQLLESQSQSAASAGSVTLVRASGAEEMVTHVPEKPKTHVRNCSIFTSCCFIYSLFVLFLAGTVQHSPALCDGAQETPRPQSVQIYTRVCARALAGRAAAVHCRPRRTQCTC